MRPWMVGIYLDEQTNDENRYDKMMYRNEQYTLFGYVVFVILKDNPQGLSSCLTEYIKRLRDKINADAFQEFLMHKHNESPDTMLCQLLSGGYESAAQVLITPGVNLNRSCIFLNMESTALDIAVMKGFYYATRQLLIHGAKGCAIYTIDLEEPELNLKRELLELLESKNEMWGPIR